MPAPTDLTLRSTLAFVALSSLLGPLACESEATDETGGAGGAAGAAGAPSTACADGGTGTLRVTVAGLPDGTSGRVRVLAEDGTSDEVTATGSIELAGGSYTLAGDIVASPDPRIRTAYRPALEGPLDADDQLCVADGETVEVTVTYAPIPSSGKLFMSNRNGGAGPLLGFASADLATSGSPEATVAANTKGAEGTFDRQGNLWVVGATTADAPLLRYPAESLGTSGTKEADVLLDPAVFGGGLPRATALAFDGQGNLWSNIVWADKLIRFTPAQIERSGAPEPQVEISGVDGPAFLAFDADGNLWTAHEGNVVRFDAGRLTESTEGAPDLVITAMSPPPVIGRLPGAVSLAFDAAGNAWVNYNGVIARLDADDLAGTGELQVTPAVQLGLTVTALPHGVVFDESGGLWLALQQGAFGRLGPEQLAAGGVDSVTPETIIESPDVASTGWFGLFPAPAGLPLHHSY
jgi:hypothetical protein